MTTPPTTRATRGTTPPAPRAPRETTPTAPRDLDLQEAAAVAARPHRSRYGSVIGKTVESWARTAAERRAYRPLVFGGTFPIDEPEGALPERRRLRETVERSVERFESLVPPTFAIDEPLAWHSADALPKDKDARYYVSGPKTFDIDEPVPLI